MTEKRFVWLAETCYPRRGPKLTQGEIHQAELYQAEVVEAWIASGAARWAGAFEGHEPTPEIEVHKSLRGRTRGRGKE